MSDYFNKLRDQKEIIKLRQESLSDWRSELLSEGGDHPYVDIMPDGSKPKKATKAKKEEEPKEKEEEEVKEETISEARDGKSAKDKGYTLRDWFKGGGWKQTGGKYDGKPCAKQPGQTTKPFCRDADDRAAMSKDERDRRAAKKRKEDPNADRSGKAKNVTEEHLEEKKDACYHKVKSRYKIWPSAYASGALVKCRKKGAKNWGNSDKK